MNIYPAILTDSLETVQEQVDLVRNNRDIKTLQIDIIDGYFVDNLTVTPMDLVDINFYSFNLDFHLMTEEPLSFAQEIADYKKYFSVRAVIGQIEKMSSQVDFIDFLEKEELKKGLSLDLFTPHEEIMDSTFKKLDALQLMAIEAGEQGHQFNDLVIKKIKEVQERAKKINPSLEIIIDGGVKLNNIKKIAETGVHSVGIGSAIWQSDNVATTLERFCEYAR
jgi:ribulose-phosphate 3-epimerase